MEDGDRAVHGAGEGFISPDAIELPMVGALVLERGTPDDLDRAESAGDAAREPDLAVTAAADAADELVVGDRWGRLGHVSARLA